MKTLLISLCLIGLAFSTLAADTNELTADILKQKMLRKSALVETEVYGTNDFVMPELRQPEFKVHRYNTNALRQNHANPAWHRWMRMMILQPTNSLAGVTNAATLWRLKEHNKLIERRNAAVLKHFGDSLNTASNTPAHIVIPDLP